MMNKTFKIGQSNELVQGGKVYDLHNQYDLSTVVISTDRSLRLSFEPNPEHGLGCPALDLDIDEIDFLELSKEIGTKGVRDIEEMGYKEPSDRDDEWLLSEDQASSTDHLFVRLADGHFIRVHGMNAVLTERIPAHIKPLPENS
jgi:hypothetical protein